MITIPSTLVLAKDTVELIEFFNKLEKDLEYPKCEGQADARRVLINAERELIVWGKV